MVSFVDFGEVALTDFVVEVEDVVGDFFGDGDVVWGLCG